jgi:ATP-dependent DNA helicase RecG
MLEEEELEALLADLESDRVERKRSDRDRDEIKKAVCAFANALAGYGAPGVLFIGVEDDGRCAGMKITDEGLRRLADIRSEGKIQPLPSMTVQKRRLRDCDLVVVIVDPADNPPVRYDGRCWVRIGPRKALATADDERRLREQARRAALPFDQSVVPGATLEDLDLDLFRREYLPNAVAPDVLEANDRSSEHQLASLRFLDRQGRPLAAAVLVLGRDPRAFIPGAYVQFVRFAGAEIMAPVRDQKELSGPLSQVLRHLDELIELNISVASSPGSEPREVRRPDYPIGALQQLARNAILHRGYEGTHAPARVYWFDDRVEIQSPGGPFGRVNEGNFGEPGVTDYRNPTLAEAMKVLGYVQKFGMGIPLARRELARNGNPPPEFEIQPTHVLVIVRRAS